MRSHFYTKNTKMYKHVLLLQKLKLYVFQPFFIFMQSTSTCYIILLFENSVQ